tara:strand:+ start:728 stop:1129 length:402 start_codon:yes stop_codon:yes gene_type:complete
MNFTSWLYKKINSRDNITYKDVFDNLFDRILHWIKSKDRFEITIDIELLKINFYLFIYSNNTNNIDNEYYSLQYSDDIVDLFLELKEITYSYGSLLLHEKERTSNDLFNFIFTYINEITNSSDEEDNLYHDYE